MSGDPKTMTGFISGERHRSAEELAANAARAATVLDGLGVGPGDRIAIMLRNDFPFIEASYGAGLLGAVAVPVNWHYAGDEVDFILRDSGAKALVVHADLLPQVGEVPDGVAVLSVATPPEIAAAYRAPAGGDDGWAEALAGAEPWTADPVPAPPSMVYTSGTTGRPKGVRRLAPLDPTDPNVLASFGALGIGPGMRTVICGPMYHTAPNFYALYAGRTGGLVVLQPRFDAEELLALVDHYAITRLHLVPTMMVRLLRVDEEVRARYDVSSIEMAVHAAAPCPAEVKRALIDWWGPVVCEYYGGTETGAVVACDSAEWLAHPGTVGKVLPGSEVRIVDAARNDLPQGEIGEVYLRSQGFGDFTYHGRDDARAEVDLDGFVTIGDVGYLDEDGFLHLCDRSRDMIISGGVNIYPAEIEAALIGHPAVADCAVFGIPDAEFGEQVAAVIQPAAGEEPDADDIRSYLRERLAGFKVPRTVEFQDELPREDSGKIFKRKLRERYWPEGQAI